MKARPEIEDKLYPGRKISQFLKKWGSVPLNIVSKKLEFKKILIFLKILLLFREKVLEMWQTYQEVRKMEQESKWGSIMDNYRDAPYLEIPRYSPPPWQRHTGIQRWKPKVREKRETRKNGKKEKKGKKEFCPLPSLWVSLFFFSSFFLLSLALGFHLRATRPEKYLFIKVL